MIKLTHEALVELCINFVFYFTIGCFGAFLKDLYETLTGKNEKIRFSEVIIGGACATFIGLGLHDTWFKKFSLNMLMLTTFILGILGFELFGNLTTIARFKQTLEAVIAFKNRIRINIDAPPAVVPPTKIPPTGQPVGGLFPSEEKAESPPEEEKKDNKT